MEMLAADDRGLLLGDGLFETILAEHGRLALFDAHVARLTAGCATIGLPAPAPADLRAAASAALTQAGLTDQRAAVRLSWTAGSGGRGLDRPQAMRPRLLAHAAPAPMQDQPLVLATATIRRNETSPVSRLKSLAYLDNVLARRAARALGADEAVMLNTVGEVAGAAAANLFWISGGRLFTPSLDCGVLAGTMRAVVSATAAGLGVEVVEIRAAAQALAAAEAVFATSSLIGVREVSALDGASFARHPMVARLAEACAATLR